MTSTNALQSRSRPSIASMMGSISFQGGGHDRKFLHAIALASSVKRLAGCVHLASERDFTHTFDFRPVGDDSAKLAAAEDRNG